MDALSEFFSLIPGAAEWHRPRLYSVSEHEHEHWEGVFGYDLILEEEQHLLAGRGGVDRGG